MGDVELQDFAHHALDLLDTRIAKLYHFAAIDTNDVVVLLIAVRLLELRHVFSKLMLGHQIAIQQNLQGIVNRSTAYAVLLVFHVNVERFHIEMVVSTVDLFQDGKTFRCFTQTICFQIVLKDFFDFADRFFGHFSEGPKIALKGIRKALKKGLGYLVFSEYIPEYDARRNRHIEGVFRAKLRDLYTSIAKGQYLLLNAFYFVS